MLYLVKFIKKLKELGRAIRHKVDLFELRRFPAQNWPSNIDESKASQEAMPFS